MGLRNRSHSGGNCEDMEVRLREPIWSGLDMLRQPLPVHQPFTTNSNQGTGGFVYPSANTPRYPV